MKLKQMIIALFVLLSVIPLILFGVTTTFYNNKKVEKILENDLKIAVSTQVKAIENFYDERRNDLDIIMGYGVVNRFLEAICRRRSMNACMEQTVEEREAFTEKLEGQRQQVEDLLRSRVAHNRFLESITILDSDFTVAACSDKTAYGQLSALSNLDPRYLTPELAFTPVIETKREGDRSKVIVGVQELYEENGSLEGYLVMEMNLTFFKETRESAEVFNNGTIYILDGKKQMVAAGDTVSDRKEFQLREDEREDYNRAWRERDVNSKQGVLHYKARGERYLSCYSDFDNLDWTIISSINLDEVMQTKANTLRLVVWIVVILAVLLLAVHRIISQFIAKPIQELIVKFRLIKDTQNYGIRMSETRKNEIGVISTEINALLVEIESYIDKEKKKQEVLKERAEKDPLTGLYNKRAIEKQLGLEIAEAREQDRPIACFFLDIDDFKSFNTDHGHIGGDGVLRFIARKLTEYIPGKAGRQGGDEFVAFSSEYMERDDIERLAAAMLSDINAGVVLKEGGEPVPIRCSIGIALASGEEVTPARLIGRADEAMYAVKEREKNGFQIWEDRNKEGA